MAPTVGERWRVVDLSDERFRRNRDDAIEWLPARNRGHDLESQYLVGMRCALSEAPLISLIRDILGTAMPHPMTESAWRCHDSATPTLWHPHSVVLDYLGTSLYCFPLTLILVILLDFTYMGSSISCLTECRVADE
ncbi:hypothetical protein Syun_025789 [Stephania yunnanensis]|uniref:Uncharacterized protein n=1 Tax=Stephania yunnanensis TaxID=152371 RepID=A0AAP0HVL2_9MAGN